MKKLPLLLALCGALSLPSAFPAPSITATQDDATVAATRKLVGDTVTYTTTISNTAAVIVGSTANDASGVSLTNPTPANTTEVVGVTISPIAFDDVYPQIIFPNIGINSGNIPYSVFTNDFAGTPAVTTIASFTQPAHGTVTMVTSGANIGQFTYEPAAGYSGADSFTYTLTNSVGSSVGTVNLTVLASPVIWFVNPAVGVTGTGTLSSPFKTVAEAVTAIGANTSHRIFLYSGAQTTGITLKNNGWLVGQAATGTSFDSVMGIAPPSGFIARPTLNSTKPALSNASGSVVILADNNTILGVAISGGATGAAVASSGTVNTGLIGNATTSDVTISGAAGGAFSLGAGNGAFNINAPITSVTGRSVAVTSRTGGTVAFSGGISDTGTGISLTSNAGATINFTGGLNLSTGANAAFLATGGGTVNATQNNTTIVNMLTTTSGRALQVSSTNIGASNLTFRSISSSGAPNGIFLSSTGATGGLIVTGVASGSDRCGGTVTNTTTPGTPATINAPVSAECTGGRITGTVGPDGSSDGIGVYLSSASNVSLSRMRIDNHPNYAIRGLNVSGVTLSNTLIDGSNGTNENVDEGAVRFTELTGSDTVTNSTIGGSREDNFVVINTGSTALTRITFTGVNFTLNDTTFGDNSLFIQAQNAATVNATVQDCNFVGARGDVMQFDLGGTLGTTASGDLIFRRNTSINTHSAVVVGGGGITISGGGATNSNVTGTYEVGGPNTTDGNTLRGARGDALLVALQTGGGQFSGKIRNNVFGAAAIDQSGAREATDIEVRTVGSGDQVVQISNNQIFQYGNFGILLQAGGQTANGDGTTGTFNATVTGNTINSPSSFVFIKNGFQLNSGTNAGDAFQVCLNLSSNTLGGSGQNGGNDFQVRNRFSTTDRLPGYGGANNDNAAVTAFLQGQNTGVETGNASNSVASGGGGFVGGAACTVPPLLFAAGGIESQAETPLLVSCAAEAASLSSAALPVVSSSATRMVTQKFSVPAFASLDISQRELDGIVSAAIERWRSTGLTSGQLATLRKLKFEVANLPGMRLGEADGAVVRVDSDAGGNGWFASAAKDEGLFGTNVSSTRGYTDPSNAPAGRIDLLTTIMHEMGHALGLGDSYLEEDRDNVMYGFLTKGERRLPATNQAVGAMPNERSGPHFLSGAVNIGTLPPNKSVKIVYSVTVGPITGNPQSISSQATISGSNFSNVLATDAVAGSGPTVTLLGIAPAFTSANATTFTTGTLGNFNVTANGAPPPTFSFTGSLPSGVGLSSAGVLSGTPAANTGGTYPITITANNGIAPNAKQSFTLTVNQPPAITSANNTTFTVGTNGNFQLTASGFPASFTFTNTGSALPSGVTMSASGLLSGTPGAGTGGVYNLTFTVSNGIAPNGTQSFTLTVNQAPAITSVNTTTFTVGTAGSFNVTATGYPSPAINLTSGSLPGGVNYAAGMGNLAGTPTVFGTFPLIFTASNGVGSNAVQSFSLVVNPNAQDVKSKPSITANVGGGFHVAFIGNPGTQYTIQFAPSIPVLPAVPNWQTLSLQTANASGIFSVDDTPPVGTTMRFYRAIIP